MRDARDIRLLGIGFVAGMVLCYFLTLDAPKQPVGGTVTMTLAQAAQVAPRMNQLTPAQRPFGAGQSSPMWLEQPTLRRYGHPVLDTTEAPDFKGHERLRIVPAQKLNNQFPGGPVQYDLIDLNYKADFKLPD